MCCASQKPNNGCAVGLLYQLRLYVAPAAALGKCRRIYLFWRGINSSVNMGRNPVNQAGAVCVGIHFALLNIMQRPAGHPSCQIKRSN